MTLVLDDPQTAAFHRRLESLPAAQKAPNYRRYEELKKTWIAEHPDADPLEYDRAIQAIAEECGI